MNQTAHTFEIGRVGTAPNQTHEAGYVVDQPDASPTPKGVCSICEGINNHHHFQLGNLPISRLPQLIDFPRDVGDEGFSDRVPPGHAKRSKSLQCLALVPEVRDRVDGEEWNGSRRSCVVALG